MTKFHAMKRHILFLNLLCLSLLFGLPLSSRAQESEGKITDPLTLSGTVGTQITSSWTNSEQYYNTPFSATAYADMTFNLYGISIPMTLNFVNTSANQFSFSKPEFTISLRPMWKGFTFHFGTSSMNFSNYTYNGVSFNGVGMDYKGKSFRIGGFYGTFNRATSFNARIKDLDAIQYLADDLLGMNNVAYTTVPQYKRKAYAAHIGVGSSKNYVDISLLHAADDPNSLPAEWFLYDGYDTTRYTRDSIRGKENLAVGLKGHFTIGKHVMFEANLGASLFTPDIARDEMVLEGTSAASINSLLNTVRKTGLFNPRFGSEVHFAGDALLNLNFKPVTATFTYRFVQPDYTSLGAYGFNQNAQTFGGNISTALFRNTAFLTLNGFLQRDNLDKKQLYTNQVCSYSASWNNTFENSLGLALSYNGVLQKQLDGVLVVPEATRIDQITHSLDFSPSYTLSLKDDHTFSLNYSLLQNKNRNEQLTGVSFDATSHTIGVGYEAYLSGPRLSIDANYDFSMSHALGSDYNSHDLACGTSYNFIENDNMTLSGDARLTLAYNIMKDEVELTDDEKKALDYLAHRVGRETGTEVTNDLSVAARVGASLNYKDRHNASIYFAVSNYSDNIIIGQHVAVNTDVRFMLEYSYSFASRLIKSKKR